jgi:hypothetical protein
VRVLGYIRAMTFRTIDYYNDCPGCGKKAIPKVLKGFVHDGLHDKITYKLECEGCHHITETDSDGYYEFYGE